MHVVLTHLRKLLDRRPADHEGDGALLGRFVRRHDEAAFTELVRRHGPMVLGVCRRVLRNADDADDAFQVTFLTLACKARSLRDGQALASWLYRVAAHVARRARANGARRRDKEQQAPTRPCPDATAEADWRELGPVLDEELSRLPENCRAALVLCCLEGKTNEEAARALGWPSGSISKRLARGRELLRRRLARRGFLPSAGVLAALSADQASAAVPGPLAEETVRAALLTGVGRTAAGAVPPPVAALLRQTLRAMLLGRVKLAVLVLLTLGLLGVAAGLRLRPAPGAADATPAEGHEARADDDTFPGGALARIGTGPLRHGGEVVALALSGDGKTVVSVGWDGLAPPRGGTVPIACVWDTDTGRERRRLRLRGFAGVPLGYCALSRDGKTLAVAEGEPSLLGQIGLPGGLSPRNNGERLAPAAVPGRGGILGGPLPQADGQPSQGIRPPPGMGGYGGKIPLPKAGTRKVRLWDVTTGTELRQLVVPRDPTGVALHLAFAADGKTLASAGSDPIIRLWDVGTGRERGRISLPEGEPVNCLAWAPDGRGLAASRVDGTIRLWRLPADRPVQTLRGDSEGHLSLAFSPDGKVLASGGVSRVRLWDVAGGNEVRRLPEIGAAVHAVAFSADGRAVAAASWDFQGGEDQAGVWEVATGRELRRFTAVRQQPGKYVDLSYALTNSFVSSHYGPLALSADGTTLARLSIPNRILLWDVASGKEISRRDEDALAIYPPAPPDYGWSISFAYSPDGRRLAAYCADGTIRLWDTATHKEVGRIQGGTDPVGRLAFVADGATLIALGESPPGLQPLPVLGGSTLRCWDVRTGEERARFEGPRVGAYAVSPDGKTLATAAGAQTPFPLGESAVFLWDLENGKDLRRLRVPETGLVTAIAFSPDGKTVASAGVNLPISLWDVTTGKELGLLSEPKWEKSAVKTHCRLAFSDGGKALVAVRCLTWGLPGANPARVSEWDLALGQKRRPSRELSPDLDFRAFSLDGKAAAFADGSHRVRVLDLATGKETHRFEGHKGQVLHAAFSPDGKTLATGGLDATILLWDLANPVKDRAGRASRPASRR